MCSMLLSFLEYVLVTNVCPLPADLLNHDFMFDKFYTKTGTCKFGATCKFHHPKDIVIPSAGQDNGGGYAGAAKNAAGDVATAKPVFSPALLHNSKGLPVRPVIYTFI